MLFSRLATGLAPDVAVSAPTYSTAKFGDAPLLDVSASHDEANLSSAVFIVNRSQTDSLTVTLDWQDRVPDRISAVYQVAGRDPKAATSFDDPNQIAARTVEAPPIDERRAVLRLPPLSFTAVEAKWTWRAQRA